MKNWNYLDHNKSKIDKDTKNSSGHTTRLTVTQTPVKTIGLSWCEKFQ